jgi:hypothetical protein
MQCVRTSRSRVTTRIARPFPGMFSRTLCAKTDSIDASGSASVSASRLNSDHPLAATPVSSNPAKHAANTHAQTPEYSRAAEVARAERGTWTPGENKHIEMKLASHLDAPLVSPSALSAVITTYQKGCHLAGTTLRRPAHVHYEHRDMLNRLQLTRRRITVLSRPTSSSFRKSP